ncbi:RNA polymerase sigma-70 factor (ECF subfamily) [Kribbella sp. VKM Ac-2527]|uniref:RNA polymerase sigma-70 factor (ECF subfamily) n=1 Tax=Kribbella caucasensis TaxID=2512215 RepID=A0A4R6JDH8_9ACTN|nr:sigma-70 family RNA polymerase sigma factor [Kribbella sp. VKM Ac-2527]TDO33869.1 RNA polymerase sigma-70 factor (ECF subfamily) [Kribbella sp. VKM Ac-2527]
MATALPSDEVLIAGLRAGDEETFARLLDGWSSSMLRLARTFVSTAASAEEVVQDTWLAVFQSIGTFEGRSALQTWVYRILVNIARKRGAREQRTVPWTSLVPDGDPTVDPSRFRGPEDPDPDHWRAFPERWPTTESEVLAHEVRATVAAAIDGLPPRQRVVLTLRDIDGHSADDVCALLEITTANQRVLLHRARAAVRSHLERYFTTTGGDS